MVDVDGLLEELATYCTKGSPQREHIERIINAIVALRTATAALGAARDAVVVVGELARTMPNGEELFRESGKMVEAISMAQVIFEKGPSR